MLCTASPQRNENDPSGLNIHSTLVLMSACVDLADPWRPLRKQEAINHALFAMRLRCSLPKSRPSPLPLDRTLLLPDQLLLRILSRLPESQRNPNSLVCKRWLYLQGRLVRSVKVLDWRFLVSGRLVSRFPSLTHVDIVQACLIPPNNQNSPRILLNHRTLSVSVSVSARLDSCLSFGEHGRRALLDSDDLFECAEKVDEALEAVARGYPNLRRLAAVRGGEAGLLTIGEVCSNLQELELHRCSDNSLREIAACPNLQVLRLIGQVRGRGCCSITDVGLTILANGCRRLVKLELGGGCRGSFEGVKAVGQCCQMLEELTLTDHRMDGGWMAGLLFCENLKALRLQSCKVIDSSPEFLGSCRALEHLHLQRCQLRDRSSLRALFAVCGTVREIFIQDCWGLDNDRFGIVRVCRRVNFLSLEGCSLLTAEGLDKVILSWKELQRLRVVSCKSIKVGEVSPALSALFSSLKELIWRPGSKSAASLSLRATGLGRRGGKFLRR